MPKKFPKEPPSNFRPTGTVPATASMRPVVRAATGKVSTGKAGNPKAHK